MPVGSVRMTRGEWEGARMIETVIDRIVHEHLVAIVRTKDRATGLERAQRLLDGGVQVMEVTWTTPGAAQILSELLRGAPHVLWGAGTVLTAAMAEEAVAVGAQFLVAPDFDEGVWQVAQQHQMPYIPGVWTATEVAQALRRGLTVLKLFPARSGGPAHMQSLHEPFPGAQFIPTGGVTPTNSQEWLAAGAVAVGMGGALSRLAVEDLRSLVYTLRQRGVDQ